MKGGLMRFRLVTVGLAFFLVFGGARSASAQPDLGGAIGDLISGVLALPANVLAGTVGGPPIIGTAVGALYGAVNALALTTRGALRLIGVAVPMAMQAAPYVLPFIL